MRVSRMAMDRVEQRQRPLGCLRALVGESSGENWTTAGNSAHVDCTRHRVQVHARGARPLRPLRAPPLPVGHAPQRSLEQLRDAAGAARSASLHARRQGARQEGPGRRDGRLKEDIREEVGGFPERRVVPVVIDGLPEDAPELVLSRLLDDYRTLRSRRFASATARGRAAAGLLVVGLQQRLANRTVGRSPSHRRAHASTRTGGRAEAGQEMFQMVATAGAARFGESVTLRRHSASLLRRNPQGGRNTNLLTRENRMKTAYVPLRPSPSSQSLSR